MKKEVESLHFDHISAAAVAFPKKQQKNQNPFIFAQILLDAVTMQQEEESQNRLASEHLGVRD